MDVSSHQGRTGTAQISQTGPDVTIELLYRFAAEPRIRHWRQVNYERRKQ